jgi:hypothetical protein
MILAPPCDGRLRLVHVLGLCQHDRIHLDAKPVIILCVIFLSGEDMVLLDVGFFRVVSGCLSQLPITILISLSFSRQARRWPRQLVVPSLQVSGEAALACGVSHWLA